MQGDTGGHTGTAPTHLHHIFPRNSIQTKFRPCAIHPKRNQPSMCNPPKRNQQSVRNSPKRNRRGGACVLARTFAQRRFHTKNTRMVRGEFNDGCAPAGRHGRAHRHRPYPSPLYIRVQSSPTISIHPNETRKQSIHTSGAEMHRALPPPFLK